MTEEDLFAAASERKDPTESCAFLDAECGGDETMRGESKRFWHRMREPMTSSGGRP